MQYGSFLNMNYDGFIISTETVDAIDYIRSRLYLSHLLQNVVNVTFSLMHKFNEYYGLLAANFQRHQTLYCY